MTDDGSMPNLQVEVLSGGLYPYWDEPSPAPDGYRETNLSVKALDFVEWWALWDSNPGPTD